MLFIFENVDLLTPIINIAHIHTYILNAKLLRCKYEFVGCNID